MDRRIVLAGLAAAVATPALAGSAGSPATGSPAPMTGGMQGGMQGGMGQMGQAEQQYMQRTLTTGMVALESSKVAMERAQNPIVRQFAEFEAAEQQTISEVLRSMGDPAATAATPGATALPADKQEMMQRMRQAQGPEFDRMYVTAQIEGHQELLRIQEEYIGSGRNREIVNVAKMARGHIREHIEQLQAMQKQMRG